MCASYGLGGDGREIPIDLPPMSEPGAQRLLDEWMAARDGDARITGRNARNLNPIIRAGDDPRSAGGASGSRRELLLAWWWIWLDGSGPVKFSAFNARDDKLLRSWKRPFQRRAILPATWYVEKGGRFRLPDDQLFGIAAITSTVPGPDGEALTTYAMVTRDAVGEAADTWHRMPLVLPRGMHDEWLDPERPGDAALVDDARLASDAISRELTARG